MKTRNLLSILCNIDSFVLYAALLGMSPVWAASHFDLAACSGLSDSTQRLHCYDELANAEIATKSRQENKLSGDEPPSDLTSSKSTPLAKHWESDAESKNGLWTFRAHKPNYFLFGRFTDHVNTKPYDVYFKSVSNPDVKLSHIESKYQLSFKLKAAENLFDRGADLWFGYTQQSFWQVYNKGISAPFRETNYEPEVFVTIPSQYEFMGMKGRFLNLGFVHQSNGQSYVLSRSWNRIYAQAGLDYGDNFSLLFKPWYRLPEKSEKDDNPNITDYMGNLELQANYQMGKHGFLMLGRTNFDFNRGFMQLGWTYPLHQKLKAYVQFTSGYGESLIDYNHHQNTFGIGVMLTDWK